MIKKGEKVLLLGKSTYIAKAGDVFNCEYGSLDLRKIIGKNYGFSIKSNKNIKFWVVKPSIVDLIFKMKRGPQIVLPKDVSAIFAVTGCSRGWEVAEAGTGSAFMTIFIANVINPGKIYTFEKRSDFYKISKRNIEESGFQNIIAKNEDMNKAKLKKNLDMIILDMENPEKIIKKAFSSLKAGGWLVCYSMHIEEVHKIVKESLKYDFSEPKMIENLWIEWQSRKGKNTRPKTHLGHTGFLTFLRKF